MNNQENNNEVNLILILTKILNSKKVIFLITLLFSFIGTSIALLSPIKFTSSTVFIPQNQENSTTSNLSNVASLVGINLSSNISGNEISPSMYPQVGQSPKFKRMLLESFIDEEKKLRLNDFLVDYFKIKGEQKTKKDGYIYVSELEEKCFEKLGDLISISVNQKDGFITIVAHMPIAEYSAFLAKNAKEILQKIIIDNKIESAKQTLVFSQDQLNEKKIEFDLIQTKLALFKDSNLNIVNNSNINKQNKLEAEFEIINAVVTELSKQVEQAKLQVNKDTPVFSTIKEAVIPNYRTSPKRIIMVLMFTFIGFLFSIVFVLIKDSIESVFQDIKQ